MFKYLPPIIGVAMVACAFITFVKALVMLNALNAGAPLSELGSRALACFLFLNTTVWLGVALVAAAGYRDSAERERREAQERGVRRKLGLPEYE